MAEHYKFIPPASGPQKVEDYASFADFPVTGEFGIIYVDEDASELFLWDGSVYVLQSGTGGATTALDNLAAVAINTDLLPGLDNTINLGESGKSYATAYIYDAYFNSVSSNQSGDSYFSLNGTGANKYLDLQSDVALSLRNSASSARIQFSANNATADVNYLLPATDGTSGQVLSTNGSGVMSWISNRPTTNPDLYYLFQTDFTDNSRAGLTVAASAGGGTGQATSEGTTGVNSTENCLGVLDMALGTGTTARMTILGSPWVRTGGQTLEYATRLAYSALSDGTNTYTTWVGFQDTTGTGIGTNGILFRYTHGTNSGRWQAVVNAAGVVTAADAGVAPSATVNQVLKIVVNQAGTEAKFYIDGTLTNTVSSGLPATSATMFYANKIEKSAGTTSVTMTTDWLYFESTRSTAR